MKNKGFILTDSLLCVIIASLLSIICLVSFKQENIFRENYKEYQIQMKEDYERIYQRIGDCNLCIIKDSSP